MWLGPPATPSPLQLLLLPSVEATFVLLDGRRGELRGHNRSRAEQRFSPASTFKIANALIGLSVGAVPSVDAVIPSTGDANQFMREWLEPMGLRGGMAVSNVPIYQELARRIGLERMGEAIERLDYGKGQIGTNLTTFWLRGPLAISAVEQTRFLSALAHCSLPFPPQGPGAGGGDHAGGRRPGLEPACQNRLAERSGSRRGLVGGLGVKGDQITPFALNLAMAGASDVPTREQLGRASPQAPDPTP